MNFLSNECINGDGNPIENKETGECATCGSSRRKAERMKVKEENKPIKNISKKKRDALSIYVPKKTKWLKGKKCAVYPNLDATDVHHMMGKVGYGDEWARENDIPLLIDERYWLPVSREAHTKITEDSQWAWENQYSFKRVTDPIFRKKD